MGIRKVRGGKARATVQGSGRGYNQAFRKQERKAQREQKKEKKDRAAAHQAPLRGALVVDCGHIDRQPVSQPTAADTADSGQSGCQRSHAPILLAADTAELCTQRQSAQPCMHAVPSS